MNRIAETGLLLIAMSLGAGCHTIQSSEETANPTPAQLFRLLPAETLSGEFVLHQRITIRWRTQISEGEESFDAALQRQGNSLLLLGLGPMQRVGFELKLEDGAVEFRNHTGREVPFQPENILADVQRVFYPWLGEGSPCRNCERTGERNGYSVRERIGRHLIEERTFQRIDQTDLGQITINYSGEAILDGIPRNAKLRNDWYGYTLEIESHRIDWIQPRP